MVPPSLWPSLASTWDFNWITGDVQEHFLSSMRKQTAALRKVTARQGWWKKLAHGEQKHKKRLVHDAWQLRMRQCVWVKRSKAVLSEKVPENRWCSDRPKDYLSREKKKWNGPPLYPSHVVYLQFGIFLKPLNSNRVFRTDSSDKKQRKKEAFFKPQTVGENPEYTWRRTQTLHLGCWSFKAVKWCSGFTQSEARSWQTKVKFFTL